MSKILFEKCEITLTGRIKNSLPGWATLFNDIDELFEFLKKNKEHLLGDEYIITIREIKEYEPNKKRRK